MFVSSAYQRAVGPQIFWPHGIHFSDGGRYVIVPALLLVSAAFVLIDRVPRPAGSKRLPAAGIARWRVLIGLAGSFYEIRGRRRRPEVERRGRRRRNLLPQRRFNRSAVPTSPPGFGVVVACDQLR